MFHAPDPEELGKVFDLPDPKPDPKPDPVDLRSWTERNHRKRSLDRRLDCLERCIASLCERDRNTMRRMAKAREVHNALSLKTAVKVPELGQMILEALDERSGNIYQPLTAADRLAMPEPKVEWEIPNWIPKNDLTFIGGRPKVGKTRIAKYLVRSLLKAEDFLGFGAPPKPRTVVLVTDDQADGDTASMLRTLGVWDHPNLIWSRRFRITQRNIDCLLETINNNPDAVVVIDSLRSITRSCSFDENSPEMGSLIYDLKQSVIDAGSTLVLIHHCNKGNDHIGGEALSGHNAIAGSGNTVLTMHYLQEGTKLLKKDSRRRLVREARSGAPADLVVALDEATGAFSYVADFEAFTEQQEQAGQEDKLTQLIRGGTKELKASLRFLEALFKGGAAPGAGLLDLAKQAGIAPDTARTTRDLDKDQTTAYRKLGRHLDKLGDVICRLEPNDEIPYPLYCLTASGAELVKRLLIDW